MGSNLIKIYIKKYKETFSQIVVDELDLVIKLLVLNH